MHTSWKKISVAAVAALAIVSFASSANAQYRHGGRGFGLGFVGGGPYYGGGYYGGPYAYSGGPYAYGGGCYIQRQVIVNRFGHRVVRRVRVCD
jgi:hypothetical protein